VRGPFRESELVETPPHPDLLHSPSKTGVNALMASGEKEHKRCGHMWLPVVALHTARLRRLRLMPQFGEMPLRLLRYMSCRQPLRRAATGGRAGTGEADGPIKFGRPVGRSFDLGSDSPIRADGRAGAEPPVTSGLSFDFTSGFTSGFTWASAARATGRTGAAALAVVAGRSFDLASPAPAEGIARIGSAPLPNTVAEAGAR